MIAPPVLPPAPTLIAPNWRHAFGGVWRLTFRRFLGPGQVLSVGGLLLALAVLSLILVRDGNERSFFQWTVGFYLAFVIPILAFLSGADAMRDEMKPIAVDYLLTRPVRRPAFVVFRYLSQLACVQLVHLFAFAVVVAVGMVRNVATLGEALPLLLLAQIISVATYLALGFFCGSITSRYLVIGLLYGGIIELGLGSVPITLNRLSVMHHIKAMLQPVFADSGPVPVLPESPLVTLGFLFTLAGVWLAVAALLFAVREHAGQKPRDA